MEQALSSILPEEYVALIVGSATALIILILGLIVAGWIGSLVRRALTNRKLDSALVGFLSSLARWLVIAAAVIASLERVGVQTTSLVALLGSAGIAIGLALQGNLAHFASGVLVLIFRPFKIDDYVELAGKEGWVKDIGLFTTTLLTNDNETVIIPNGTATGGVIMNYSKAGTRRVPISVGVAYGSKVPEVIAILKQAAARCDAVKKDPAPVIAFVGLGASSLDFFVLGHCEPADYPNLVHQLHTAIYEDLEAAGIEIPFSQIVVHNAAA